jgi:hypothetical protein
MKANVNRSTLIAAYAIAICADFLQICLFPLFSEGFISVLDDFSDVMVCGILTYLIGFHLAFLPSFLIKLIPVVESAPTWTLAVLIATRRMRGPAVVDVPTVDGVKPEVIVEREQPPKSQN